MPWTPEEKAAYMRTWRANNVEHRRTYTSTYDATHRPQARARANKHSEEHRAEVNAEHRALMKRLRLEDPEKLRVQERLWARRSYKKHPERAHAKRRARRARIQGAAVNDLTDQQWEEIQQAYGYRCVYCPPQCWRCQRQKHHLTQDHITPLSQGGNHTVSNIVPACLSCNSKKFKGPPLAPVQPLLLTLAPARKPKAP